VRSHILVPIIVLAIAAQVCCCCTMVGGPQPPYPITASDEAIQRFQERWATAVDESTDGSFTITITDEEMTSLLAQMLAEQDELAISQPQVHFRNGRVEVYATVTVADPLALPGMVALSVIATDSEIGVTLEEMAFGPLPIPEPILEPLTDTLNEMLSESILAEMDEATITDIQIGEGQMTISGRVPSG